MFPVKLFKKAARFIASPFSKASCSFFSFFKNNVEARPLSSSPFLLHQQYWVMLDPSRPKPHDILVTEKSNNIWNSLICDIRLQIQRLCLQENIRPGEDATDINMPMHKYACTSKHKKGSVTVMYYIASWIQCAHTHKREATRNWMEPERNDHSGTITFLQKRTEKGERKRKEKEASAK